jgi:AcrR family transcriptional regulator
MFVNIIHFLNMVHETAPLTRRERKRNARINGIIDAAMQIATQEGLSQVTTHRLARELDLAVGALYRYFPSKDAIIEAMQRRSMEDYGIALSQGLDRVRQWLRDTSHPDNALVELIALAMLYRQLVQELPQHYHLNNQVMGNPQNVLPGSEGDRVVETMMDLFRTLAKPVLRAQENGLLLDSVSALDRVILYWSSLRAVVGVQKLAAHDTSIDGETLFREMVLTMLRGCGAEAQKLHTAWNLAAQWTQHEKEGSS